MSRSPAPHRFSLDSVSYELVHAHGGVREILAARARVGTADTAFTFMDAALIPPGADIGRHTHGPDDEETYVFVSGHGTMHVDGTDFRVGPGDVVVNRPGGTHGF